MRIFLKVLIWSLLMAGIVFNQSCKPDPEEKAAAIKVAEEPYKILRVIETSARTGGARCPVDKFKAKAGDKKLKIKLFSPEQLRYLQGKAENKLEYWDFQQSQDRIRPLESYTYIYQIENAAEKLQEIKEQGYAAIIASGNRLIPTVMPGDMFNSGHIRVRIVILDLEKKRGVCAFYAAAENSETVYFKGDRFKEKLKSDLEDNYRSAVRESFKKISGDAAVIDF